MGETVPASLRKVLIDSHVAAVTIAILIFTSIATAIEALWYPAWRILSILIADVSTHDISISLRALDSITLDVNLTVTFSFLLFAPINLAAAWLLSRWVYGTGPLRVLGNYRGILLRKKHA
jgi:hypothetical protein